MVFIVMTDVSQWAVVSPAAFFFGEFASAIQWIYLV